MFRELGAVSFVLGCLFTILGMWETKRYDVFIFRATFGPILIYLGLQLLIR
jgi:predicted membrane protein